MTMCPLYLFAGSDYLRGWCLVYCAFCYVACLVPILDICTELVFPVGFVALFLVVLV